MMLFLCLILVIVLVMGIKSWRQARRLQRLLWEAEVAEQILYEERNQLALLAADLAHQLDMKAWTKPDKAYRKYEWWIVYIQLPTGQVSWHVTDEEEMSCTAIPRDFQLPYDGHTSEEKRARVWAYLERGDGTVESIEV